LTDCFHALRKDASAGVDEVTYAAYLSRLEDNLQALMARLQSFQYHPQPVRRVYIEKASGGQRPLGMPCLEDKIVQEGMRRILHAVFEGQFLECSHGCRPRRSCHTALQALESSLVHGAINYVLDADISG
jgi:retron-type reverse transcriptase